MELRERVRGRFPAAVPLPPRPELDALLEQAGAERVWRDDAYYPRILPGSETGTAGFIRYGTLEPGPEVTPDLLDARALEEKLSHAAKTGAFLAFTVEPRRSHDAEAELLRRFPRAVVSLERLMLQAMRAEAEAGGCPGPRSLPPTRWPITAATSRTCCATPPVRRRGLGIMSWGCASPHC
jgi:hypothetical protein